VKFVTGKILPYKADFFKHLYIPIAWRGITDYNITMINWYAVKKELLQREGINAIKDPEQKRVISVYAENCLNKARHLAKTKASFVEKDISCLSKISAGKKIRSYIKNAEKICAFVVTIGSKLENEASRLMKENDQLSGYLLDRIGSFAVENLAEDFEDKLRKKYAAKKKSVSGRFSPGYCDWPTSAQSKLSKLIGFGKAGIKLTKSCMMVPKKSISSIVAIGPGSLFSKRKSQCSICDMNDCNYRRVKR